MEFSKNSWFTPLILGLIVSGLASISFSQKRKPSSVEERTKAAELIHSLEIRPIGDDADKARKWLNEWLRRVNDVNSPLCSALFQPGEPAPQHAEELSFQVRISMLAFMLEHAAEAEDPEVRMRAGIAGLINAYQSGLHGSHDLKTNFVDFLITKRDSGQLPGYTREVMARCSDVPLSDQNSRRGKFAETVYASIEVSKLPNITSMPPPRPVFSAPAPVNGTCVVQVVLGSSQKITDIELIRGNPSLNKNCIEAAKEIKFEPALLNGRPVSTLIKVVYSFFGS